MTQLLGFDWPLGLGKLYNALQPPKSRRWVKARKSWSWAVKPFADVVGSLRACDFCHAVTDTRESIS